MPIEKQGFLRLCKWNGALIFISISQFKILMKAMYALSLCAICVFFGCGADADPAGAIRVKIIDEGISGEKILNTVLSAITLIISAIALKQVTLAKRALKQGKKAIEQSSDALKQNISERNLHFLSEMDRMMVENLNLWAFYKSHRKKIFDSLPNKQERMRLKFQIRAFIYYKLNNFEIALLETNHYHDAYTLKAWKEYFRYCLKRSPDFEKIVWRIVSMKAGYRGIFKENFEAELYALYQSAFPEKIPALELEREVNSKNSEGEEMQ